jgi:DNA invertase Pin-like site-specific DNA recombinase
MKALNAEQERRMIRQRTSAGLQEAKARGKRLGRQETADANRLAAAARDAVLEPILRETLGLSAQKAADVIEQRGLGKISLRTVMRARVRLGLGRTRLEGVGSSRGRFAGIAISRVLLVA